MREVSTLEQRLSELQVETPNASRVAAAAMLRASRRARPRVPRALALAPVLLLVAVAVGYFCPAADAAVAGAPIAGDLLRQAGLQGVSNRVTAVGAVAESSHHRLRLVGAYADPTRTVLLVHADPPISGWAGTAILHDQFGRAYENRWGSADMLTGDVVLGFEALAWPDSLTGARVELTIAAVSGVDDPTAVTRGSWHLPATLAVDPGTHLATPAEGQLGQARFRFASVQSTPGTLAIAIDVTGVTAAELDRMVPNGVKGAPALALDLYGPDGTPAWHHSGDLASWGALGVRLDELWLRTAPGDYRLVVSFAGNGAFERTIRVP